MIVHKSVRLTLSHVDFAQWSNSWILWCVVHRLAREAGLEYVEIQNLTEFYDDNRFVN